MTSISLEKKIRDARSFAVHEVPKARLCAEVIFAFVRDDVGHTKMTIDKLKGGCGNNWSWTHAFQFMSGRRGEFASAAAPQEEQVRLKFAHLLAKEYCHHQNLGAVQAVDGIDLALFRSIVTAQCDASEIQ